jgi:uncharacterized protein YukE
MTQLEPITQSNSTTGAGVIDTYHSLASAIEELKTAHGGDRAAVGVEIGVLSAAAVLDTVAFALDPLAKLIAAGLGWLIEHVKFLRWPLDQIAGDPDQIKVLADKLHGIGEDLRNAAKDMDAALAATIKQWQGPGFDAFRAEMDKHRTHIDDAGHSVDTAGYVVETTMALIAAARALFRDIITTLLGDIISTMLIALALAPVTFGASIAVGVTKVIAEGTIQVAALMAKLAALVAFAGRVAGRIKNLAGMTKGSGTAPRPNTPHENIPLNDRPPATPHDNTPPATPHEDAPPATPHNDAPPATPHEDAPPATPHNDAPPATPHEDAPPATPHDNAPPATPHDNAPPATTHDTPPATPHENTPPATPHQDDPFATWLAADQHFNPGTPHESAPATPHDTPPATPHEETPPVTPHDEAPPAPHENTPPATPHEDAPHDNTDTAGTNGAGHTDQPEAQSLVKPQDIDKLKGHEKWLKDNFNVGWTKVKFVDDWVKKNAPDSYPLVKAMSDAKSSKNWVGWVGKDVVTIDKQLTDIQTRAEAAWQASDEKWRQDHPDPAAR